jgi:hypothetical protein
MAKETELKPKYGDMDSIFLDNSLGDDAKRFVETIKNRFGLQLAYDRVYSVCVLSSAKKAYFSILPSGESEIKGLAIAKSNSPTFFQATFQNCLTKFSMGRRSPNDFELAKRQVPEVVREAIRELRDGRISLSDLEYRVELREDPQEKSRAKMLPQPYQAAWLLLKEGKKTSKAKLWVSSKFTHSGFKEDNSQSNRPRRPTQERSTWTSTFATLSLHYPKPSSRWASTSTRPKLIFQNSCDRLTSPSSPLICSGVYEALVP